MKHIKLFENMNNADFILNHIERTNPHDSLSPRNAFAGFGGINYLKRFNWNTNTVLIQPNDPKIDKTELYPASKRDVRKYMTYRKKNDFPPIVIMDNGVKYTVIDGAHRLQAAINLNIPIRAYIGTYENIKEAHGASKLLAMQPELREEFKKYIDMYVLSYIETIITKYEDADSTIKIKYDVVVSDNINSPNMMYLTIWYSTNEQMGYKGFSHHLTPYELELVKKRGVYYRIRVSHNGYINTKSVEIKKQIVTALRKKFTMQEVTTYLGEMESYLQLL